MDETKKQKLKEMLILEDEKSILLADKIDKVGDKVEATAEDIKTALSELNTDIEIKSGELIEVRKKEEILFIITP